MALILYNNIEYAQAAVKETKGWKIGGNKIKVCKTILIVSLQFLMKGKVTIFIKLLK